MTVATFEDACREHAMNCGDEPSAKRLQWILTPWDTWERNPHYSGPDQPHPEGSDYEHQD